MINDKLNIVFFGTSEFAVPALEILIRENYNIVAVITAPDKPAGRKKTLSPSPVKLKAESLSLKVLQPATLKDEVIFENFKNLNLISSDCIFPNSEIHFSLQKFF